MAPPARDDVDGRVELPRHRGDLLILAFVAALPFLSLVHTPTGYLADPESELPVKLWGFETFLTGHRLFGGFVDTVGWPHPGSLNDPDPVGVLVTGVLRPVLGRAWAWNGLVYGQLLANMLAMRALLRGLTRSRGASVFGAVAFGLTPLILVYCVVGAVSDMLNVWPWILALRFLLAPSRFSGITAGVLAGVCAGLGFVTCPYNALVFSILAIPLLPFVLSGTFVPARSARFTSLAGVVLGAALVAGPYAWQMQRIMSASSSQMSTASVEETRHAPPFPFLLPAHPDRYTAFLDDYVGVGKARLIEREAGSRYYRAFSPGLCLYPPALAGLVLAGRRRKTLAWSLAAVFCAVASLGPYRPITATLASTAPDNLVWLLLWSYWPGTKLLLEPFRYALPATVALTIAAAQGLATVERRSGSARLLPALATLAWLVELVVVSPVPIPLPTASLAPSPAALSLKDRAGAVLELPYFAQASERFQRVHFYDQLVHGQAIPDEVLGFPAHYLRENNYTAALLAAEKPHGRITVQVSDPSAIEADRITLGEAGFSHILVDRAAFGNPSEYQAVAALLKPWGAPVSYGNVDVYDITERTPTP